MRLWPMALKCPENTTSSYPENNAFKLNRKRGEEGMRTLTAYVEFDSDTQQYVGIVPGIPGAHTQAKGLDELKANLKEVLELCMAENKDLLEELPQFVGVQQVEVGV